MCFLFIYIYDIIPYIDYNTLLRGEKVKKTKKDKKPFVKTRVKRDNSIEVEIQKSPAKTLLGKIFLILVVIGTVVVPVVALIYLMIQNV